MQRRGKNPALVELTFSGGQTANKQNEVKYTVYRAVISDTEKLAGEGIKLLWSWGLTAEGHMRKSQKQSQGCPRARHPGRGSGQREGSKVCSVCWRNSKAANALK